MSTSRRAAGSVGAVETRYLDLPDPVPLDCGRTLERVRVAYETYGELSPARDNVILVCHALSGDAHAAGTSATQVAASTRDGFGAEDRDGAAPTGLGWWDGMIGPGKAFDTDHYFVVSTNLLGGCRGTTGPSSIDPATGTAYGVGLPGHHRRRHGAHRARLPRRARHRPAGRRRRRLARRDAGARVGGQPIPTRSTRSWSSPAPTPSTRRASRGTRSPVRRSGPTPTGRAATTTAPAASPTPAWASRGWSATSPTCPRRRSRRSSTAGCSSPTTSATRSPSRSSRSRTTCATRPTRS